MEYERDDEIKKRKEEVLYGPRPEKEEVEIVKVTHINGDEKECRV